MKTASEIKDFPTLLTLSTQLQKLSNMIAFLADPLIAECSHDDKKIEALQAKYRKSVAFTSKDLQIHYESFANVHQMYQLKVFVLTEEKTATCHVSKLFISNMAHRFF